MNRKIAGLLLGVTILVSGFSVFAENPTGLDSAVNGIWMKNYPGICEKVNALAEDAAEKYKQNALQDEGLKYKYGNEFEEKALSDAEHYKKVNTPDVEKGYKFYHLNSEYAVQYAKAGEINYLLTSYWLVPKTPHRENQDVRWDFFDINAAKYANNNLVASKNSTKPVIPYDLTDFVSDYEGLEALMSEAGAEGFVDFKVIDINGVNTVLYFKYSNGEYGILIKDEDNNRNKPDLEHIKVYDFSYVLEKIGETQVMGIGGTDISTKELLYEKNIYEAEAKALQQEGLLQGNEKGLDLYKPLTRAEAVTLLVRAMGLDGEAMQYTESVFADIPTGNWAAPYAALARDKGIAYGVSDTEFDPDAMVTADQFAAFTLRAMGENDFDYTQGIEIMVDKGIVTEEQSASMNLFTRGDMAKIVYEVRAKGRL